MLLNNEMQCNIILTEHYIYPKSRRRSTSEVSLHRDNRPHIKYKETLRAEAKNARPLLCVDAMSQK